MKLKRKHSLGKRTLQTMLICLFGLLALTFSGCSLHRKGSVIKGPSAKIKKHNNVASAKRTYKKNRY